MRLWYVIKKFMPNARLRKDCGLCSGSLHNLTKKPIKQGDVILLTPGFNCSGVLMEWHIGRTTIDHVKPSCKIIQDVK